MSRNEESVKDQWTRCLLALGIPLLGIIGIATISTVVILCGKCGKDSVQLVFTSVLPLVGTWIGTVMAFYFAKENYESASRLLGPDERLRSTPAALVMRKRTEMTVHTLTSADPEKEADELKIQDLLDEMDRNKLNRLPILSNKNVAVYLPHRSTLAEFITVVLRPQLANDEVDFTTIKNLTLGDLKKRNTRQDQDLLKKIKAFAFVARSASLADVKTAMESKEECNDVLVTETGQATEPVLGWITNKRLTERSKA